MADGADRPRRGRELLPERLRVARLEPQAEQDDIVGGRGRELVDDLVAELLGLAGSPGRDRLPETLEPPVDRLVAALDEPVRVEHERRALLERRAGLGPSRRQRVVDAERQARTALEEAGAAVRIDDERRRMTGKRVAGEAGLGLEQDGSDRSEAGLVDAVREPVEPAEQLGRAVDDEPERADRAAQLPHRRSGLHAAPDHVADHDEDAAVVALDDGVPVAAHLEVGAAGQIAHRGRHRRALHLRAAEQAQLERLRSLALALVQPRVLDCHRRLAAQIPGQLELVLSVGPVASRAQRQHAERAPAERQRRADQRPRPEHRLQRVGLVAEPELGPRRRAD